jgi:hypothetical protein
MTIQIVNSLKYVGLLALILFSVIACEKDFENIGVGLVDNNQFTTKDTVFEVTSYNINVDASRVDDIPQYLLGVYRDDNFGLIKTSFISQLALATRLSATEYFGYNVAIDAIVLDIPYYATRDTNNLGGTPNFKLDSIIGDQSIEYNLSVYELGTFLNTLDPLNPTQTKKYYSNEDFEKSMLLYSGNFTPNRNDTVLYVNRRFLDDDVNTIDDIDTIKKSDISPSIKIELDTVFFRNKFINQQNSSAFESSESFIDYFRGIIIEADGLEGSLMTLPMTNASISIYYTHDILTDENGTDLNGDGDTVDLQVPVRTKQTKSFPLSGKKTSQYIRDYSNSQIESRILNPDMNNGDGKLFIQGAAGSNAIIELFKGISADQLNEIRSKNWLINEARLTLYLDESSSNNVPEQLYLYNYNYNSQILDVLTEGIQNGIGGILKRDDDNNPDYYKFNITDYISEVLKINDSKTPSLLALKVFHSSDIPLAVSDTILKDYSWIAKGVVLKGNNLPLTDEKRLKLEIFYTINNE